MAIDWPLLGRELEIARIAAALEDNSCGGVLLIGPAGVGKTRLATHFLAAAAERGHTTHALRATPSATAIPFAALAPLLRALDLAPDGTAEVFTAVADAFAAHSGSRRPVVLVDDALELDDASAALLDQLVAANAVFALLTVRADDLRADETAATVAGLWKDEHVVRIDLEPLAAAEMRGLVDAAFDGPVEGATGQALVDASHGNVLFLRELVQGGREANAFDVAGGLWRLNGPVAGTARLRDLIRARVVGVSPQEREAIELIALAEPMPLDLASALVSLDVLEGLERRALVEMPGDEVGLVHPLYGEVLRAELTPVRRARLCRMLADASDDLGSSRRGSDFLRSAHWRLEGTGVVPHAVAMQAGALAFSADDYELAVRFARIAWDSHPDGEVGLLLGNALDYASRREEAETVLARAFELATDDATRTAIASRRASNLFRGLGRVDDADAVVEAAVARISDPGKRRDLDALRANHLVLAGDVARALELTDELLRDPGDAAFAQASLDAGTALALAGRTSDALRHTEAALAARVDGDDMAQLSAVAIYSVARALALCEAGRLVEAEELAHAGYATSINVHSTHGQAWFASTLARVLLCRGRLAAASHLFREAALLFAEDGHPGQRWGLGGLALAAGQLGDRSTAEWAMRALEDAPPTPVRIMDVELTRGRAWAAVAGGHISAARAALWDAVALARGWGQHGTAAAALHDLLRIAEDAEAAKALDGMADLVDGDLMQARISYGHATTTSDPDAASTAAVQFETCGALLFAAEARSVERRLCDEMGLRRRASEAAANGARLLNACEGARTPALSGAAVALSDREREVALLFATGLTSREVAERLYLSRRTVENHLQRAYIKLGVNSRDELESMLR